MNKTIIESLKENKKSLIILSCLIVLSVVMFIFGKTVADPNTGYLRNQVVDGLSFENANISYADGITTFMVEVYNESGDIYSLKTIDVSFKDKNDKETILPGYIGDTLEVEEGKYLKASIDQDLSDTISISYKINK